MSHVPDETKKAILRHLKAAEAHIAAGDAALAEYKDSRVRIGFMLLQALDLIDFDNDESAGNREWNAFVAKCGFTHEEADEYTDLALERMKLPLDELQ